MIYKEIPKLRWYAQSQNALFSATQIKHFDSNNSETPINEEFKSDKYICTKNLNSQGIFRYGVTNGLEAKDSFVDFYIQNDNTEDFHYKTLTDDYVYGISIKFSWLEPSLLTGITQERYHIEDNFAKYLTLSRSKQKTSQVKFNDIFVHKIGHVDVMFGEQKELIHDGYSVGFETTINIDGTKMAKVFVRGNIGLIDTRPRFTVIITPNFACRAYVILRTNDEEFKTKTYSKSYKENETNITIIKRTEDEITQENNDSNRLKSEYRSIARFVDWSQVPKELHPDWDNDNMNTIGKKFLLWSAYLKEKESRPKELEDKKILETEYFTVYDRDKHPVVCHYKDINGYIDIEIKETGTLNYSDYLMKHPISYKISHKMIILEGFMNLAEISRYKITFNIEDDNQPPVITVELKSTCRTSGSFRIDTDLKYKELGPIKFDLDNETLIFETKLSKDY